MNWVGYITTRSPRVRRKVRFAVSTALFISTMSMTVCTANAQTSDRGQARTQVDPALIQALHQETHDTSTNTTDLESLVWLSAMSQRLERRIPNAFYRIRLLSSIYRAATSEGLDPQLVLALIDIESNFNRNALSHAGAQGLMQVMPFWKNELGSSSDDLFNPLVSLRYGCKILRHYMDKHPDPVKALAAYNGSLGRTVYPDKVFGRLKSTWQFEAVSYPGGTPGDTLKIASSDPRSAAAEQWVLN